MKSLTTEGRRTSDKAVTKRKLNAYCKVQLTPASQVHTQFPYVLTKRPANKIDHHTPKHALTQLPENLAIV